MELNVERLAETVVIAPGGRIETISARDFRHTVEDLLTPSDRHVVLDLGGLPRISSAGLRALLLCARAVRDRGIRMTVCGLNEHTREVVRLTGLDQLLTVVDRREDAL